MLLRGTPDRFSDATLADSLREALAAQHVIVPPITVQRVNAIPLRTSGKAPLVVARQPVLDAPKEETYAHATNPH